MNRPFLEKNDTGLGLNGCIYDEDYFINGQVSGKSLYTNYHWMPDLTIPMVVSIISHCGIEVDHSVLDFGCARGYTVRAFRELGYHGWGHDISQWALENADESVKEFLITNWATILANSFDWVVAKDVLEHVQQAADTITDLMNIARVGVFAVVPLGYGKDGYIVPEYDLDVTHIHRFTLPTWASLFVRPGWSVMMAYRVLGIKDNYSQYTTGNGFITARRI